MAKPNGSSLNAVSDSIVKPLLRAVRNAFDAAPATLPKSIRFEALEPRVLLAGDAAPAAQTVTGAIDAPGEVDTYGLNLADNAKIVLDSLTNNSNFNWTLTGPRGTEVSARSFANTDSADQSGNTVLDLLKGDYTLSIDAQGDATGAYGFRIIDLAK